VHRVHLSGPDVAPDRLPCPCLSRLTSGSSGRATIGPAKRAFCMVSGLEYKVLTGADCGVPEPPPPAPSRKKKAIVTGC